MESFEKKQDAYKRFREAMLKPVALEEQGARGAANDEQHAQEQGDAFENMPPEEKLNYFSLNASMLSHTTVEISILIEMAKEKGVDIQSEMQTIQKAFHDFYALGNGESSFRSMSETTQELFWKLRKKVADDEVSFNEVLVRTRERERELLEERDSYLAGD